jgi:hypothetical protein
MFWLSWQRCPTVEPDSQSFSAIEGRWWCVFQARDHRCQFVLNPVCTENLSSVVVVMKSAKDGA